MINRQDCMTILVKIEADTGVNVNPWLKKMMLSKEVPTDVLKFIAQNRGFEVANFYEMLRQKHNDHKSKLYKNILESADATIEEDLTTLSCFLTQAILYSRKLSSGAEMFLKDARAEEVSRVLNSYFSNRDASQAKVNSMLELLRSDLLVMEYIAGRRDLD